MNNEEIKSSVNAEKLKVLNSTLEKLEKTFGKGSIMRMGDTKVEDMDVISTGSIGLDTALGVGGFPLVNLAVGEADRRSVKLLVELKNRCQNLSLNFAIVSPTVFLLEIKVAGNVAVASFGGAFHVALFGFPSISTAHLDILLSVKHITGGAHNTQGSQFILAPVFVLKKPVAGVGHCPQVEVEVIGAQGFHAILFNAVVKSGQNVGKGSGYNFPVVEPVEIANKFVGVVCGSHHPQVGEHFTHKVMLALVYVAVTVTDYPSHIIGNLVRYVPGSFGIENNIKFALTHLF